MLNINAISSEKTHQRHVNSASVSLSARMTDTIETVKFGEDSVYRMERLKGSMARVQRHMKNLVALVVAMVASALLTFLSSSDISLASVYAAQPTHIYTQDESGVVKEYVLVEAAPTQGGTKSYTVCRSTNANPVWTIECRSGVADENAKLLDAKESVTSDQLVERDGDLYYAPAQTLDVSGVTYQSVQDSIRVNPSGGVVEAYYVPAGYELTGDYGLTIRYANIATPDGAPIEEHSYIVSAAQASTGANQAIAIPTSIKDGAYVLVPGQLYEQSATAGCMDLDHNYFAPERSYTIYYRDINDAAHQNTVITRIDTVFAAGSIEAATNAETTIEDEANPLAAPGQATATASTAKSTMFGSLIAGLTVGGCSMFVYFIYKKRTEDKDFGNDSYISGNA